MLKNNSPTKYISYLIINIIRLNYICVISSNSFSSNYSFQTNKFVDNLFVIK